MVSVISRLILLSVSYLGNKTRKRLNCAPVVFENGVSVFFF